MCDCEGYEKKLFTADTATHLVQHDLLIEIHDFIDPGISQMIMQRFQYTHDIEVISSVDDHYKALFYRYIELQDYGIEDRKILLAENRPTIMQWYFIKSRRA